MATDQEIRDAGFKYIPQQKYLQNPFELPTTPDAPVVNQGIVNTNAFTGGGGDGFNPYNTNMSNVRQDYNAFPSRQAGEIYSKTFNPQPFTDQNKLGVRHAQEMYNKASSDLADPFNRLAETQTFTGMRPSKEVMDYYGEKILDNQERYRTQGQYVDPYDPNYSSMTAARKAMDNYPDYFGVPSGVPEKGIPAAIKRYMQNSLLGKGFGMAKDFLGRVIPINERAIMENEARGAGIFTDDIGRIVTDDYNTAGGIMAGYNLNKIDADSFQKRRDTINEKMSDKINPETGKTFKQERLDLLDQSEEDILGARKKTKQIYKMRADKKAKDKKTKDDTTGTDTITDTVTDTTTSTDTSTDGGGHVQPPGSYDTDTSTGGSGDHRTASNAPSKTGTKSGGHGYQGSTGSHHYLADGGRVYFFDGGRVAVMNGGLISLL